MRAHLGFIALSATLGACSHIPYTSAYDIRAAERPTAALLRDPGSARFQNVAAESSQGLDVVCGQISGKTATGAYGAAARFITMADGQAPMIEPAANSFLRSPEEADAMTTFQSDWSAECLLSPAATPADAMVGQDALTNAVDPDIGPSMNDVQAAAQAVNNREGADDARRDAKAQAALSGAGL